MKAFPHQGNTRRGIGCISSQRSEQCKEPGSNSSRKKTWKCLEIFWWPLSMAITLPRAYKITNSHTQKPRKTDTNRNRTYPISTTHFWAIGNSSSFPHHQSLCPSNRDIILRNVFELIDWPLSNGSIDGALMAIKDGIYAGGRGSWWPWRNSRYSSDISQVWEKFRRYFERHWLMKLKFAWWRWAGKTFDVAGCG